MQAKAIKDWEDNLTMEGVDVTEQRQKVADRIAREKVEAALRVYKFDRLESYIQGDAVRSEQRVLQGRPTAHLPFFGKASIEPSIACF